MEKMLNQIMDKLNSMEKELKAEINQLKQGQDVILHKLDIISEQVAFNTEKEYDVKVISEKVNPLDIDIKIIKKAISN